MIKGVFHKFIQQIQVLSNYTFSLHSVSSFS